jgi:hypothetical protein
VLEKGTWIFFGRKQKKSSRASCAFSHKSSKALRLLQEATERPPKAGGATPPFWRVAPPWGLFSGRGFGGESDRAVPIAADGGSGGRMAHLAECTNLETKAEPQQIVAQGLLSCLQYPVS